VKWYLCAIQEGPETPAQSVPRLGEQLLILTGSESTDLNTEIAIRLDGLVAVDGRGGVGGAGGSGCATVLLALELEVLLVVVVNVKTKSGGVDVAVAPDEESTKDWLSQHIKDAIEDGLRVRRDIVATLAKTPSNRVKSPKKSGQGTALEESGADILAHRIGVLASFPGKLVDDVEQSSAAKGEVSPLVASADESTSKASDDHDLIDEDGEENRGPGHAGGEKQVGEQEGSGDDPVDVANIEDLAVKTSNLGVAADELNSNASPAKVRSHREVSDGGNHGNGCSDVVEDTLLARLGGRKSNEGECCSDHDRTHSPVPIRTADGDGNLGGGVVDGIVIDLKCSVTHLVECFDTEA